MPTTGRSVAHSRVMSCCCSQRQAPSRVNRDCPRCPASASTGSCSSSPDTAVQTSTRRGCTTCGPPPPPPPPARRARRSTSGCAPCRFFLRRRTFYRFCCFLVFFFPAAAILFCFFSSSSLSYLSCLPSFSLPPSSSALLFSRLSFSPSSPSCLFCLFFLLCFCVRCCFPRRCLVLALVGRLFACLRRAALCLLAGSERFSVQPVSLSVSVSVFACGPSSLPPSCPSRSTSSYPRRPRSSLPSCAPRSVS